MFRLIARLLVGPALLSLLLPLAAVAKQKYVEFTVAGPLLDLRTGPGRGYPVFYIAERGETVQILMRRTDWYEVRTERQKEGWVSAEQIQQAVSAEGVEPGIRDAVLADYLHRNFEAGFAAGAFDGDPVVSFRAGYQLTDNLITELDFSQVSGTFTDSRLLTGNLMLQPYAKARFSPFFTIGGGWFQNRNRASLIGSTGSIDATVANAGIGARYYLAHNFLLRIDYRKYMALTSVEKDDQFDEESVGVSFFF